MNPHITTLEALNVLYVRLAGEFSKACRMKDAEELRKVIEEVMTVVDKTSDLVRRMK